MSRSMNPVDIRPEQVAAEIAALGEKIARGTKLFREVRDEDVAIATTPKDEIWRQDLPALNRLAGGVGIRGVIVPVPRIKSRVGCRAVRAPSS